MSQNDPRDVRVAQKTYWSHLCDTNGDGTGVNDATGAYSVGGPGIFHYECQAGERININRLLVYVRMSGAWTAEKYGAIAGGLSDGILVRVKNSSGGVRLDLLNGLAVVSNADWARECHDSTHIDWGSGDEYLSVRWIFRRDSDSGVVITAGEKFEVVCQDDLSTLAEHRFKLRGETFPQ